MTQSERHALQQLSITEWEHARIRRADDLARALAGLLDSARALPDGCHDTHRLLGVAAAEIRGELRATLNRRNPLRRATSKQQRCAAD
jgi:hypothetical protein